MSKAAKHVEPEPRIEPRVITCACGASAKDPGSRMMRCGGCGQYIRLRTADGALADAVLLKDIPPPQPTNSEWDVIIAVRRHGSGVQVVELTSEGVIMREHPTDTLEVALDRIDNVVMQRFGGIS